GANRPKLANRAASQKTSTTSNGVWLALPACCPNISQRVCNRLSLVCSARDWRARWTSFCGKRARIASSMPGRPYSCVRPRDALARLRTSRRHQARSLVRIGRVALQSVHHARLGRAKGDPVLRGVLERNEKRLGTPQRLLAQALPPLELELVGELADERPVIAPRAPERDVRQGGRPVPEVQDADVLQHLLDDRIRDDLDPLTRRLLEAPERRKDAPQGVHRGGVILVHVAKRELDVV